MLYMPQTGYVYFLTLSKFVSAFIDFPKPLIGLINGPAVGVSVTVLGLFDAVYATDRICSLSDSQ